MSAKSADSKTAAQSAQELADSQAFDAGSYASAYTTEDYGTWRESRQPKTWRWEACAMLGFFSSYEISEVPGEWRDDLEHARAWAGKHLVEAGE